MMRDDAKCVGYIHRPNEHADNHADNDVGVQFWKEKIVSALHSW
jgi:hypothetical protein